MATPACHVLGGEPTRLAVDHRGALAGSVSLTTAVAGTDPIGDETTPHEDRDT